LFLLYDTRIGRKEYGEEGGKEEVRKKCTKMNSTGERKEDQSRKNLRIETYL
jgi:hypothetical protein